MQDKFTILGLLRYVFGFLFQLFKKKQDKIDENNKLQESLNNKLENTYNKIDSNKQENKQNNVEDRLNNLFK